ncbi:GlcG/HbpS family heme-binding protein [Methylohalobius crimeensis]|uniref:GlcG/HbpS family heme-binding protein n=1 Tax=Methylohalobius crimeensis TaxID=244365 RepID=UPI0003B6BCDF|nr:heme-binding protein [Methylohalobius crimeensis]
MWNRLFAIGLTAWFTLADAGELAPLQRATLSMNDALQAAKAAKAALADCQAKGYEIGAAVVDDAGHSLVSLRSNGAGPHTLDSSWRKAYTALSLRKPTHELARMIAKDPEIQALHDMNESILILGGGLPIRADGHVVGGIGVGGAPGAMLDVACARAGLKAIGVELDDG